MAKTFKKCDCPQSKWTKCPHPATVRYREPGGRSGRQREKTLPSYSEAKAFGIKVEHEKYQGTYADPLRGRATFKTYAEEWLKGRQHRPGTADGYARHMKNHIYPTFGGMALSTIRQTAVQSWVKSLSEKGLAPSTVETVYTMFAAVIRGAVLDDRLTKSPCQKIRLPEKTKTQIHVLTPEEVWALYSSMERRYAPLVLLGALAGLRQGEAFGICLDCVPFLQRKLTIKRQVTLWGNKVDGSKGTRPILSPPKTRASNRDVPMADLLAQELSTYVREFPSEVPMEELRRWCVNVPTPASPAEGPLFITTWGKLINRTCFSEDVWRPAIKKAGLPEYVTFHDLRHTFASTALAEGVPISDVSKWLGHASITETVDTYGHLVPEADDRARKALDRVFNRAGAESVLTSGQPK